MASTTILFGMLLVLLGVVPYLMRGAPTALIPAVVGVILLVLGGLARNERYRKHAMHTAALVGLVGFMLAVGRLIMSVATGKMPSSFAAFSLGTMATLTAVYIALCVRSFVNARRQRQGGFEPVVPPQR